MQLASAVEAFLKTVKNPNTRSCYEHVLLRLIAWMDDSGVSFDTLSPDAFGRFLNDQAQWSAVTRYLCFNVTRAMLRWQFGEQHPLRALSMKRPRPKPQRVITQEQFGKLLEHFNTMSPIGARDLALFALMAETGLRASEVCNLKMKDLYLDALSLVAVGKGGDWKMCKISPITGSFLAAWLAHREGIALPETDTVFCSVKGVKKGLPNDRFGLLSRCREISKQVGFQFNPHVFRRLFATRFLELGGNQIAAMRQGGWKSESEFKRYIQTYALQDVNPFSPVTAHFKK